MREKLSGNSSSDDGHSFGGIWTLIKLEALGKYLQAFNSALSKQTFTRLYIDAFAGTGRCDITVDSEKERIDGSAKRALATVPAFHRYCFIDRSSKKLEALKALESQYPGKLIERIAGDANSALKTLCEKTEWANTRAVLFLDPYGMHVEWATLESIAKTGAIDVWYLFPYSGLYRQAAKNSEAMDNDKQASISRLLGTDEWRQDFYRKDPQVDLFGRTRGDIRVADHRQMLDFVSKRLKMLFPAVSAPKVLYQGGNSSNPSGAPLFALYFAAANPAPKAFGLALKIANDVLRTL